MRHERELLSFDLDLGAHEVTRRAAVLGALVETGTWDPGAALAAEQEAYRLLYSGLDPAQEAVLRELVAAGVLDA